MKAFPRDINVRKLKERHIGVESELGIKSSPIIRELPDGLELKLNKKGLLHSVGYDGGGREFRTNPIRVKSLLKQKLGKRYFEGYYMELRRHTTVLPTGGTHIHISILDSDHENMEANAVALSSAFYREFQAISGRQSSWAPKLSFSTYDDLKQYLASRRQPNRSYYTKGYMLSPTAHKTLEFRGPKGSNNPEEVLAWIDFINRVVEVANRQSVNGVKFGDLIKGPYITKYVKSLIRRHELSKDDLNKTLNLAHL